MTVLTLEWTQAEVIKAQIEAVLEAVKLGGSGQLTMGNGCTIQWNDFHVKIEVPKGSIPFKKSQ